MTPVEIKICGITRVSDALEAVSLGASMIGLNFYPRSPRFITLKQAQYIASVIAGRVKVVGVFVNMNLSDVLDIARAVPLDAVQLHGDESPTDCEAIAREFPVIRALKVDAQFNPHHVAAYSVCRGLLLDTPSASHGGSGENFDWNLVPWTNLRQTSGTAKVFLAGGLHAANVSEAIAVAHPDVVDVCSGVESSRGIKSITRMREFVAAVRAAERQQQ